MKVTFFILLFLVLYSYFIYPGVLRIIASIYSRNIDAKKTTPVVTLIISAFNEGEFIAKKLENSLSLIYPKELLEIMVVSDCSTDNTDEIVKGYENRGIALLRSSIRRGKTAGLNDAITRAKGETVVFSDADSMYAADVIEKMVRLFGDPKVGLVTGTTQYMAEGTDGMIGETTGIYTKLERWIKEFETIIGSCVGADGAIFAIRKSLYQPLENDDINDFVIPMKIIRQGARAVFDRGIICREGASRDSENEFRRQIRITNRTIRALFRNIDLINIFKYPMFSFQLVSHKWLRFMVPFFMVIILPVNIMLLREGPAYFLFLSAQICFYLAALTGLILEKNKVESKIGFAYHFLMVNISFLFGWLKFLSGDKQVTWNPQQ